MRRMLGLVLLVLLLSALPKATVVARQEEPTPPAPAPTSLTPIPTADAVQIISPKDGQALQGSIPIVVNTTTTNFQSVELTFAYMSNPSGTRFWIYQGIQPVTGTMLVLWDTSTLTDGNYQLRMEVTFSDGSQQSMIVKDLRIRNYTPIETSTPPPLTETPTQAKATSTSIPAAPVVTQTSQSLPTAQPANSHNNPITLSRTNVTDSVGLGVLTVFALFVFGMVYQAARSLRRKE
jgi:hypothetical protein